MMQRIQMMSRGQRVLLFILIFGGGLMLICALTLMLALQAINTAPREQAFAQAEGVTVREFAVLPDDDAYPGTVAVGPDGDVYTGSYDTGALWRINAAGLAEELTGARESIGSLRALAFAPDGTLYLLDGMDSNPRAAGGMIWHLPPGGALREFGTISGEPGFVAPHDLTTDADGNVYVSDRGRREVWRFASDGVGSLWWNLPAAEGQPEATPSGLAYDPVTDSIIITDLETDIVYRVSLDGTSTDVIYRHEDGRIVPGLDGVTVAPDGTIYMAAFADRSVVVLQNGELIPLAGNFRGSSAVAYHDGGLYVNNFDQRSLILPGIQPQLPFALDRVELNALNTSP